MRAGDDTVEGKIAGIPITVRGVNMAIFLAFAALAGLAIWTLGIEVTKRQDALDSRVTTEHSAISTAIEKQTEALVEQNYILLADDRETQELRKAFRRPESLRRKLGQ